MMMMMMMIMMMMMMIMMMTMMKMVMMIFLSDTKRNEPTAFWSRNRRSMSRNPWRRKWWPERIKTITTIQIETTWLKLKDRIPGKTLGQRYEGERKIEGKIIFEVNQQS